MNEKRDRLLIEKLLGYGYLGSGINDVTYREPLTADRCTVDMANFFFLLWNGAKEKEWWNEFVDKHIGYRAFIDPMVYQTFILIKFINPQPFMDALAKFLGGLP